MPPFFRFLLILAAVAAAIVSTSASPYRRLQQDDLDACTPDEHQCQCQCECPGDGTSRPGGGGRSIRIAVWERHCLRLQHDADAFVLTPGGQGLEITLDCLTINDLDKEILSDVTTQTGYYDGFMFGPYLTGDMVSVGGLHDLTDFVTRRTGECDLRWTDIFRFNREHAAVYDHKVVMIPLDGDVLSLYYRKDLFEKYGKVPPKTWEEYTDLAKFFHNKEENLPGSNDTVTLSGSCVGRKFETQEEFGIILILSSMTQHAGTKTGFLFDTENTESLEPLLGEAFVKTIQFIEEQFAYGAPNEMDGDITTTNIAEMNAGSCAMTYNWGDSFTEGSKAPPTSYVSGLINTAHTPGSNAYFDRKTMKLAPCSEDTCVCSIESMNLGGCTNMAPYAAFTGWSGGVNNYTSPSRKDVVTNFFAYASSPEVSLANAIPNITGGAPYIGVDPFRVSHTNPKDWIDAGLPEEMVVSYLGTIEEQQSHENVVLDVRFPLAPALMKQLKIVMNEHMSKISERRAKGLTGKSLFSSNEDKWAVERSLRSKWNDLIVKYDTDHAIKFLEVYQRSLGIHKTVVVEQNLSKIRPIGLTLCCILLATSIGFASWTFTFRWNNIVKVSQPLFLYTFCFGCFVLGSSIIPLSIDDSVASDEGASIACMAFPWLVSIGFTVAFSALYSKLRRIKQVMDSSVAMQRVVVKHTDVIIPFSALLVVNVTILSVWTIMDPLQWERTYSDQTLESTGMCKSSGDVWTYCISFLSVINFAAIVAANIMGYQGRRIGRDFVESKWIMMSTASICQVFLIGTPLLVLVRDNPVARYFVSVILVFVVGESILLFIFLPKIYELKARQSHVGHQVRINLPNTRTNNRA